MSNQVNQLSNDHNFLAHDNSQWSFVAVTESGQAGQVSTPSLTLAETEMLLEIDGLLEIAQLIRNIKESGRLKTDGKESIETEQAKLKGSGVKGAGLSS